MDIGVLYRFTTRMTNRLSEKQLMIIMAIVTGLMTGLGVYAFEQLLHLIKASLTSWFAIDSASFFYFVYPTVGMLLVVLFVKYIVKDDLSEGVTQVLYAISRKGSKIRPHNCYSSVVAGATTIGFGGSVGPESPIIMTGAAIGSNVGKFLRMNYRNTTLMIGCGVAAACAAIFKAPITGVAFVIEIIMMDLTISSIIPLLISAVTATSLVFALRGFDPIFSVTMGSDFLLHDIPYFILMGVVCGLVAYYFTEMNSFVARQLHKIKQTYIRLIVGGAVIGSLIFLFPPLYGEGYEYLQNIINGNLSSVFDNSLFYEYKDVTWILILYLVGVIFFKVIAMSATNASGGVGGVFAPSLFIGAFTGAALSLIMNTLFGLELSPIIFALVGMAGIMSGVLDAPLTAIFLIAEVTDSYELFVPLMMVSAISYMISYYLEPYSIYTRKLVLHGDLVTHDKDKAVLLFLDIRKLIENDMERVPMGITLGEMVKVVSRSSRNIFPVLDNSGYLQGVVTLDDIRRDMFDRDKYDNSISEYMTIPPDIIAVNDSMQTVLDKFETSHAWNLPVVDESNQYIGFVSKSKIFSAYRNQLIEISHN